MVLTKSDIAVKVHELGFTKKTAVDTVESLLEIIKLLGDVHIKPHIGYS